MFEPPWDKCAIVTKIKNTKSAKSKNFLYLPMRESPVVHMSTTLLAWAELTHWHSCDSIKISFAHRKNVITSHNMLQFNILSYLAFGHSQFISEKGEVIFVSSCCIILTSSVLLV